MVTLVYLCYCQYLHVCRICGSDLKVLLSTSSKTECGASNSANVEQILEPSDEKKEERDKDTENEDKGQSGARR